MLDGAQKRGDARGRGLRRLVAAATSSGMPLAERAADGADQRQELRRRLLAVAIVFGGQQEGAASEVA